MFYITYSIKVYVVVFWISCLFRVSCYPNITYSSKIPNCSLHINHAYVFVFVLWNYNSTYNNIFAFK